ncbi:hypothetical protein [Achromobacter insolitus]|uniref:hypothetical protein n=1 Tax=Achromobacter insolitus TaxID=217204 RepID=UPI000F843AA6|nr:hypothetical protein [Achromobacter insolitus]
MSENEKPVAATTTTSSADWLLQEWVDQINRLGISASITLQVNGLIVSGVAIPGDLFFEKYAELMASAFRSGSTRIPAEEAEAHFKKYANIYKEDDTSEIPPAPPEYIHLEDARYWNASGQHIPGHGVLWRGRLSQVSGYNIGSLTPSK